MSENIQPQANDVFTFDTWYNHGVTQTMKIQELQLEIIRRIQAGCKCNASGWMFDGVGGALLQSNGNGWIKGKIILKLEFIPNAPQNVLTKQEDSPLDELRHQINQRKSPD